MKKLLSIILIMSLILTLGSTVAFADAKNINTNSQLYIATTACPQGYVEYAEDNIAEFVESHNEGDLSDTNITVGNPFSFLDYDSDVYYFPVICNGVIRYIFRVYPNQNNGYNATLSSFLATELEALADYTSAATPLRLNLIGKDIVASIGNNEYVLFSYPEYINNVSPQINAITNEIDSVSIVNAKADVGIDVEIETVSTYSTNSWSYYIELNITETQGSNSWCAAYATSTILRTLGYSSTAQGVMNIFYRRPQTSDSISRAQVVEYANMRGLHPILVEDTVANATLYSDLKNGRPVYFGMTSGDDYHAVVLRGYNSRRSTWSIWNPWFTTYETFSMGGTYVPTGHSSDTYSFTYERTIYNWKP